jgi:hypothetical protein
MAAADQYPNAASLTRRASWPMVCGPEISWSDQLTVLGLETPQEQTDDFWLFTVSK